MIMVSNIMPGVEYNLKAIVYPVNGTQHKRHSISRNTKLSESADLRGA